MDLLTAHGFVDGSYLRKVAIDTSHGSYPNPRSLIESVVQSPHVQSWGGGGRGMQRRLRTACVTFYDAEPEDPAQRDVVRSGYLNAVELLHDTHLGFGALRGRGRRTRQKAVDTLIAVDMLVGAFTKIFDLAVLVSGDADFVPVVHEVRRRGASVVVVAHEGSVAGELRRAADRFVGILKPDPLRGLNISDPPDETVFLQAMQGNFPLDPSSEPRAAK